MIKRKFLMTSAFSPHEEAAAGLGEMLADRQVVRIHGLKITFDSTDFGMEAGTGVKRDLGDEVRRELRSGRTLHCPDRAECRIGW